MPKAESMKAMAPPTTGIKGGAFDLVEQAGQYGSSHSHPMNRIIHFIFVPQIILSFFLLLCAIKLEVAFDWPGMTSKQILFLSLERNRFFPPSAGLVTAAVLSLYYVRLDPVAGSILGATMFGFSALATFMLQYFDSGQALFRLALALQIVGWSSQIFVGHGMYEKRAPALMTSLFQVIVSPFFLTLEALFWFGWNPPLAASIEKRAQAIIKETTKGEKKIRRRSRSPAPSSASAGAASPAARKTATSSRSRSPAKRKA